MNSKSNQTGGKKAAAFDSAFEKYAKTLSKDYVEQFKRPEFKQKSDKQKVNDAFRSGKNVEIVQKSTGNKAHAKNLNIPQILDDEHVLEIKEVPKEIATQVAKARAKHNLTQEQLAKKISEKTSLVVELEKGDGVYDPEIVVKIEKALNEKFTRSWKK
jgi:ribosome-binding protein aMBF1 (putative translation factor)